MPKGKIRGKGSAGILRNRTNCKLQQEQTDTMLNALVTDNFLKTSNEVNLYSSEQTSTAQSKKTGKQGCPGFVEQNIFHPSINTAVIYAVLG